MRPEPRGVHKRLVAVALMITISGFFVSPRIAHAIPVFESGPVGATIVKTSIMTKINNVIWASAAQGLMSAISLATKQFAYDMAVGLASGAKGQNPLAFLSDPGAYANSLAQDATAEFIGGLSGGTWDNLGFDLCKPQLPQVALKIQLGLGMGTGAIDRPKPKCQWQQIANNWSTISSQIQNPNLLLQNVSLQFKPGQSDIGAAISAEGALANKLAANQQAGILKRLEGNGILPKEGLISGKIETPASIIKRQFEGLSDMQQGLNSQNASTTSTFLAATTGSEIWLSIGKTMLSTFANTLSQKLLQNVVGGLFKLARGGDSSGSGINLNNLYALNPQGLEGTQAAQQAYANLLVSNIKTGGGMDLVTEFASCPQKREEAGLYNCVIDAQFSAALQQSNTGNSLTVRDAIAQHFLDATKPFGYSDPLADKEPDVIDGYSYSNMKKLRLARVIPVGWEFAAEKTKEPEVGRKTLGEVIDGFAKEGTVPGCGQPRSEDPTESPFCGLVDPLWVLKVPAAQCAQVAAGKLVDASGSRMESCIDLQNCVAEDGNGNCKAWGYCTKEKRSWSVGGETCPAEYATCQGFQNTRTNAQVSYLRNTLDSTTCNSENAGCRWYSTARNVENANWKVDQRIYLNGKAESCAATAAGCTEFVSNAANLLQNSGFEKNTTTGSTVTGIDGWQWNGSAIEFAQKYSQGPNAFEGSAAVEVGDPAITQTVPLEGATQYILSAYGKGTGAVIEINGATVETTASSTTCSQLPDPNRGTGLELFFNPTSIAGANTYGRASCTFFAKSTGGTVTISIGSGTSGYVDAVQLEKGATATPYHDGYGANTQSTYLKAPPTWLGCTGEEGEPSECRSYARVCRRDEVGCEQYSPVTADPSLTGTVTAADRCPQECVGYAAYKQESSAFEGPLFPQYIIPTRANACVGEDIGCAAFTNLQSEKVEYYREVRACELPRLSNSEIVNDSGTYVTWEGSENSGYQIKNWLLKQSPHTVAQNKGECSATKNRCSNASDVVCHSDNDCIVNAFGQGQAGDKAIPPCTNYELVETGGSLHMECHDTPDNQAICLSGQVGIDPDCRGFYDAAGDIFYRKYSRTVLVTDKCSFSRIGGTGAQLDEGACLTRGGSWNATSRKCAVSVNGQALTTNLSDEVACKYGRGTWRSDRQECVYAIFAPESRSCQAASLGCREYTGNAGNNVRTVFDENFDNGIGAWQPGAPKMVQSSEAVNPGGYAARVDGNATRITHTVSLDMGATYVVEFWAKGTGTVVPQLASGTTVLPMTTRGGILGSNWQHFSFGPTKTTFATSESATVAFELSGSSARMYIDNISVKKIAGDKIALIQASTKNIPISCDSVSAALGGASSPQYMLGCAEYKDRAGASQYIKSFSRFCRASSVGCSELSNTQNTTEQFGSTVNTKNSGVCRGLENTNCYYNALTDTYQAVPGDTNDGFILLCHINAGQTSCTYSDNTKLTIDDLSVPAHARAYLVVDAAGSCKQEEKGCQVLGQQTSSGWNAVYYKNLPDTYGETMCRHEENGCDAWTGGAGAVYFKATTGTNECAWKDNVMIAGSTYNGWFKTNAIAIAGISAADPTNQAQMNAAKSLCEGYGRWDPTRPNTQLEKCYTTSGTIVSGVTSSVVCQGAGGHWAQESNSCTKTDMPCYGSVTFNTTDGWNVDPDPKETFLIGGKTFGVWKNIDPLYRGQIASCPSAQIGCTELVDRNDCTDANRKNCTAYYVKDNDKLDKKTCREKNSVSAKDGCVLFDDTSDPEKQYNTDLSYQNNRLTASLPSTAATSPNNANVLLKVKLDRSCAEWLTCQSAASVFDSSAGRFKLVCNSLGRCNEMVSRPDQGEIGQCANWVDQDTGDQSDAGRRRALNLNARLTREIYQKRDIRSFTAVDFSGYSIPGYYPLDRLMQVSWKSAIAPKAPDFRLAAVITCKPGDTGYKNCADNPPNSPIKDTAWPFLGRCTVVDEGLNDCGPKDAAGKGTGRCYANKTNNSIQTCIQNPDGSVAKATVVAGVSCRAYPDRTSPFPKDGKIQTAQAFADSTICDDTTGVGCECDYKKASYGGLKDFYYAKDTAPEPKVCVGGTASLIPGVSENSGTKIEGQSCIANSECVSGDCRALNKVTNYKGVRGYCLEEDLSRSVYGDENQHPCLTWLPSDSTVGSSDIYNQYVNAGVVINPGNEWYCSARFENPADRVMIIDQTNARANFKRPIFGGNKNVCGDTAGCGNEDCEDNFAGPGGGFCNWPWADSVSSMRGNGWGPIPENGQGYKTNLIGCYELSYGDDGNTLENHAIDNAWIGVPIHKSMIEAIQVVTAQASPDTCYQNGHSLDQDAITLPGTHTCNFQIGYSGALGGDNDCKIRSQDEGKFVIYSDNGEDQFLMQPIFDEYGYLTRFHVEMREGGGSSVSRDAGSVDIRQIKIALKPGCKEIQRVSEKGAYTDRLWNKGYTDWLSDNRWYRLSDRLDTNPPSKDLRYNPEVRYTPWGAIGPNPVRSSYIVDAMNDPTTILATTTTPAIAAIPDYCKSPGSQWCGLAYNINQLKQLFARTDARAQWSPTVSTSGDFGVPARDCKLVAGQEVTAFTGDVNLCYVRAITNPASDVNSTFDITQNLAPNQPNPDGQAKAPNIRPVVNCQDDGKCQEGNVAGVTIADKSGAQDLVLGYGGLLQTTMRFYAWADKDHMPLKRIVVDWHGAKDGGIPEYDAGYQNYYRNRRGLDSEGKEKCVDEKTAGEYVNRDKYGFGSILNQSCDNAYFKFQITYTCSGKTSPFWEDTTSCPLSEFASRYGGCCVFQPRAKVVDNWDWCSGNGGQATATGSCSETKGWVNFAGKVLVAPKFKQN